MHLNRSFHIFSTFRLQEDVYKGTFKYLQDESSEYNKTISVKEKQKGCWLWRHIDVRSHAMCFTVH